MHLPKLKWAGITTVILMAAMVGTAHASCPAPRSAPELDPSLLTGSLTVLVGGGLMLVERLRRR